MRLTFRVQPCEPALQILPPLSGRGLATLSRGRELAPLLLCTMATDNNVGQCCQCGSCITTRP